MLKHPKLSLAALDLVDPAAPISEGLLLSSSLDELDVIDPATGEVVGDLALSSVADAETAVRRARKAFDDGPWPRMSPKDRYTLLKRLVGVMDSHRDALAEIGTMEVGTPISLSRNLHAGAPIAFMDWFADTALTGPLGGWEERLGTADPNATDVSVLFREPIGVVSAITAYNFPLLITAFKIGGAMAAGCTSILMPSPRAPLASIALVQCLLEADLPRGLVHVVVGGPDVGRTITTADGVDMVTFTGSVEIGRQVGVQATGALKKLVLELGGKSPNVLLPGVEPADVVGPSVLRFTRNAGQGCGATTRTLVPRDRYADYATAAKDFIDGLKVGDPWDEATDVGPLIRSDHRERVQGFVDRAVTAGAVVEAGGGRPDGPGFFVNPILLGNLENEAEACQEEIFGPVGVLIPYDTVDEAFEIANGTRYGLNANVWGPTEEALAFARRLKAGTITVNGGGPDRPEAPWPGIGDSGVGVDRGLEGFREFFRLRHVQAAASPPRT